MTPWTVDLIADRWTPFSDGFQFPPGIDLTGDTCRAQVRVYRDAPGPPLIDLQNAPAGTQGLAIEIATDPATMVATSTIRMMIAEATLRAIAKSSPAGGDIVLAWDLHVTLSSVGKRRWIAGSFTIRAGATQ